MVVGGNLVPSQAWWEPYRWRVWVTEKRCCCRLLLLAAVLVFSTRGEEGNFHVRLMQGPRAVWLPYMVLSCRWVHTGTGGHGQTRHGWIQDELGPAAATATATAVRDTHTHTRRAHEG